jgi:endoglucanase
MTRREFLEASAAFAAGLMLPAPAEAAPNPKMTLQPKIPLRRGFNLTELSGGRSWLRRQEFRESDFQWMAEWGFNFARLPLSYWVWSKPSDWMTIDEAKFGPIDRAVEWGRQYGIHVNLCLHRIPGYCVNGRELEPCQLFDSPRASMDRALAAAAHHWRFLAERYQAVPGSRLSFDLLNEPPFMTDPSRYVGIVRELVGAIRGVSPGRLIVADGADIGQTPVLGLVDLGIVQSIHCYQPKMLSHYTADWVPRREFESFATPTWPMLDRQGRLWDRDRLREVMMGVWEPLTRQGVPVHVGEWGCYNHTPHGPCLAWMNDLLALWKEAGWGWSMWNLRGAFGILDSGRADVSYENFRGHKLDRRMLELLLAG